MRSRVFTRPKRVALTFDGVAIEAYEGETIAAALIAAGERTGRRTLHDGTPRGYYCGMGVCHDCMVEVDGQSGIRACMTPVRDGAVVSSQRGNGEEWPPS